MLEETRGVRVCTVVNDYAERFDVENISCAFDDAGLPNNAPIDYNIATAFIPHEPYLSSDRNFKRVYVLRSLA